MQISKLTIFIGFQRIYFNKVPGTFWDLYEKDKQMFNSNDMKSRFNLKQVLFNILF